MELNVTLTFEQDFASVPPAASVTYFPDGQAVHVLAVGPEYFPAGHYHQ
jgi:hypothetical protein